MFCHECDYAIGDRYVMLLYGAGRKPVCLECALALDAVRHGQPVYVAGRVCPECGEPECHDCSGVWRGPSREAVAFLCCRHDQATAPYVERTDHEHHRNAQLARAIRGRLARIGAVRGRHYVETENGRLRVRP